MAELSKDTLEREKLRLEIIYIRRNFRVQIFNSICLIAVALAVLYFFQRPQIGELEANRLATEKHQVATLLITVQGMANEQDKKKMMEMLAQQWPQHEFIAKISQSNLVVSESRVKESPSSDKDRCAVFEVKITDLQRSEKELLERLVAELNGIGTTRVPGYGPVARVLEEQVKRVRQALAITRAAKATRHC